MKLSRKVEVGNKSSKTSSRHWHTDSKNNRQSTEEYYFDGRLIILNHYKNDTLDGFCTTNIHFTINEGYFCLGTNMRQGVRFGQQSKNPKPLSKFIKL